MRFAAQPIGRDPGSGPREADRRTNYQRGADFERSVREHLMHDLDACYVVRAAGSHGIADLVALFPAIDYAALMQGGPIVPVVWLVQVKRDGILSAEERELLMSLAAETGCKPWLAWQGPRGELVKMKELRDG